MKKFVSYMLVAAFVATSAVVTAPGVEAASSINGVMHSGGQSLVSWQNQYQYIGNNTAALESYIRQLENLLAQLRGLQSGYYPDNGSYGVGEVEVTTRRADHIEDDAATLLGTVDFNSSDEAVVYFRWGTSPANLTRETSNIVLDADDDIESFSARLIDLDEDETYYFRAVAEDERGRVSYGTVLSFRTDDDGGRGSRNSNDDEPDVKTGDADRVTDTSARISGRVNMNDFDNGLVFAVYGEDENQVDDIARDYNSYRNVSEDGDDLQKVSVDTDLDGSGRYEVTIRGLNDDTEIFYTFCVEYEDEDGYNTLTCGDTESFETDN